MTGSITPSVSGGVTDTAFDFDRIWKGLQSCTERGIRFHDDSSRSMVFRSYSRLYSEAGGCAHVLVRSGIRKGDIVLLSAATDHHFMVAWLACFRLGAVPATIPPRAAFMNEAAYLRRLREVLPFYRHYICFEAEMQLIETVRQETGAVLNLIPAGRLFTEGTGERETAFENNLPSGGDTAYVQFSSGSTGTPKGLMITCGNMMSNLLGMQSRLRIDPLTSCVGSWMPLYHDMGFVGYFLFALFTQTNLVLVPTFYFLKRMFDFFRMFRTYGVNYTCMTTSMLEIVLCRYSEQACAGIDLSSLKWMGVGAEPVNIATLKKFQDTFAKYGLGDDVLSPCYGLAEATLGVSMETPLEGYGTCTAGGYEYPTLGLPLNGVEAVFEKDETLPDELGILKIRGAFVAEHSIIEGKIVKITDDEGYYNTKDIGCFRDGRLVITGRSDTMFIVGGENFFPHEVESVLTGSGLLPRPSAVCIAVPPARSALKRTELVVVYEVNKITPEEKVALDEELAKTVLKNTGLQIDVFVAARRGEILYTTSGKIRYNELRERYLAGVVRNFYDPPV